jgi:hypothetical protein
MTFPLVSTINAAVQATQDVYDGVVAGDPAAVINTLVNLPANLVNGFLNGSGTILGFINAPGLLTPYDPNFGFLASGPIASLIALRDVIAQAIGATPPSAAASKTAAATVPTAAKTVTLATAPKALGKAGSARGATKAASESVAESTAEVTTAAPAAAESSTGRNGSTTTSAKTAGANDSKADTGKKGSSAKSARAGKAGK